MRGTTPASDPMLRLPESSGRAEHASPLAYSERVLPDLRVQRIFGKLQVQRRTEAVARVRELGLS